jgi:hypothetical protein
MTAHTTILNCQDEPRVYWCRNKKTWLTDTDVCWYDRRAGVTLVVPSGFATDLASVPFYLQPLVAMHGNWNRAAILHDWLYSLRGVLPCGKTLTRKQADRIFLDAAIVDGTSPFVAMCGYYGIRANPANWPIFKKWGEQKS